jgi:adenine-specific DNA glycosylase
MGPIEKLFEAFPEPELMASANSSKVSVILKPTGFPDRKAEALIRLSKAYSTRWGKSDFDLKKLPGVGKYAQESWRIFIDGDTNFEPEDRKLKAHVTKAKNDK